MTTRTKVTLIAGVTMGLLFGAGRAAAQEEGKVNYRCENAMAEADAAELRCMDRCEKRTAKQHPALQEPFRALCAADCHQRCDDRKKKVEESSKCGSKPVADPDRCAGKQLNVLAQHYLCLASCSSTPPADGEELAPEVNACLEQCDQRYSAARDRINASEVCALGGTPACVNQ